MQAGLIRWRTLLLTLLLVLRCATAATDMIESSDHSTTTNPRLICYSCTLEHFGAECATISNPNASSGHLSAIPAQTCAGPASRCEVWRFYSEKGNDVYIFERGCSSSCTPGCVSLEDMENRFVSCYSCCNSSRCNIDNAAVRSTSGGALLRHIAMLGLLWSIITAIMYTSH
uniref:Uncharacterized protein n=1 Tax=Plectus sambesii TaxID=2011161 RepID=A0A914WEW9_9BILA